MASTPAVSPYTLSTLLLRVLAMIGAGAIVWWASVFIGDAWGNRAARDDATAIALLTVPLVSVVAIHKVRGLLAVEDQADWPGAVLRRLIASAAVSYVVLAASLYAAGAVLTVSGDALWLPLWILPLTSALITWQWSRRIAATAASQSRRLWWTAGVLLGAVIVVVAAAVGLQRIADRARQREEGYQEALRSHVATFTIGMPRRDVEARLRADGRQFDHACCISGSPRGLNGAWDVLVPLGAEHAPWYCSVESIYIGFEFTPDVPRRDPDARDEDRLTRISLFRRMEGCL